MHDGPRGSGGGAADRLLPRDPLPLNVLLAEDDRDLRGMLALLLRRDGHRVTELGDGAELADELHARFVAGRDNWRNFIVVADVRMPIVDSLTVLGSLGARGVRPRVVLMSAFADDDVRARAFELDALALFDKPFDFDDLRTLVRHVARWR